MLLVNAQALAILSSYYRAYIVRTNIIGSPATGSKRNEAMQVKRGHDLDLSHAIMNQHMLY